MTAAEQEKMIILYNQHMLFELANQTYAQGFDITGRNKKLLQIKAVVGETNFLTGCIQPLSMKIMQVFLLHNWQKITSSLLKAVDKFSREN